MRGSGTMYKKRHRVKEPDKMKSSKYWERKWMVKGMFASSAFATFSTLIWLAFLFPVVAASLLGALVVLATVSFYIFAVSRDIDFNGDMKQ
jgi:hypothetical protein